MNEFGSFSKETASLLNINTNTLRRWSIELEKKGYEFERNEKDQRIYYKRDVVALKSLQSLMDDRVSMENACFKVASEYINKKELSKTLSVHEKSKENSVQVALSSEELAVIIERSVEKAIEKERTAMLKVFESKMNDLIESRDRELIYHLNKSMEQKRLEIAAAQDKEVKKGFWTKFLRK